MCIFVYSKISMISFAVYFGVIFNKHLYYFIRYIIIYVNAAMNGIAWMDVALKKAAASLKVGEVPVGCLFIYNDAIIAESNNSVNETCNATRHAEMNCIDQVLVFCKEKSLDYKKVFRKIDIIVTVEPCIMCTSALYQLQVRSIIYGCKNDRFGGCISVFKVSKVYNSKVTVLGDIRSENAINLLKYFYEGTNPNAPEPKTKKVSKIITLNP